MINQRLLPFNPRVLSALAESVTSEQLTYIKVSGASITKWARYRKLYKWSPVYLEGKEVVDDKMPAQFLNGESYWIPTQFNEELANRLKPLPLELKFGAGPQNLYYIIDFEPFELMDAFEKLGANGEKVFIEFDAQVPVTNMKIRVYNDAPEKDAKTPKEYIELKKFRVDP